jgi:hypothetical protein
MNSRKKGTLKGSGEIVGIKIPSYKNSLGPLARTGCAGSAEHIKRNQVSNDKSVV